VPALVAVKMPMIPMILKGRIKYERNIMKMKTKKRKKNAPVMELVDMRVLGTRA
jgi:hypothetical protein